MKTRTVDVGSVQLEIAEAGPGGRPFLLMHGFTGAKEDFTDWLDKLADDGWHAVAPDHRGHGASAKPLGKESYSLSVLSADNLALVDALGWERYVLLGHSMGGFVAQLMAFADPGRLRGLILMDTGHGPIEGVNAEEASLAARIATESGMAALAELMASRESPLDTPANRRVLDERPGYAEFGERKFLASSPWMYAAMIDELLSASDALDRLVAMAPVPPTLVMVGEQDRPFLGSSKRMADAVPGSVLAVIPDAGHSPQFENPAGWWQALSSFLATVK
ncbi:MAG TPA: alpha/beta hydrolase [Acidimicrobiales bacterium]|nr:alpha/beta hydrolase [Acidimicrobiales bacterium]